MIRLSYARNISCRFDDGAEVGLSRLRSSAALTCALALLCVGFALPVAAQSSRPEPTSAIPDSLPPAPDVPRNAGLAIAEVAVIDVGVWAYDRYVRPGGGEGFRVGWNSWAQSFQHGFEYDDNHFATNQFAHPYQGNMYFNSARSNGFGYWGSLPYSFLGSFTWEYFAETNFPAYNDWVNTGAGGAALGETFYRLSSLVLDNRATGFSRVWRETVAALIDPVRGFNRIVSGRSGAVSQNPPDWRPNHLSGLLTVGARTSGEEGVVDSDTTDAYFELDFEYGDPFGGAYKKPFETFDFELQHDFGNAPSAIARMQAKGILGAHPLGGEPNAPTSLLAAWQRYDYVNNFSYEFGGQSATAGYLGRFGSGKLTCDVSGDAGWLMIGAIKSDYKNFTGREYDFGSGVEYRLRTALNVRERRLVQLRYGAFHEWAMSGNDVVHRVQYFQGRLNIPILQGYGVLGEYGYYDRHSNYANFPDVHKKFPEIRVAVSSDIR